MPRSSDTETTPRMPSSRLTAKQSSVPMKVTTRMRAGTPYQRGERFADAILDELRSSGAAFVEDREFESLVGREQFGDLAQTLGERGRREQRIIALAQIVVIDVEIKREQVDGNRIGESGFEIFSLVALGVGAVRGGELAGLPGIERSFPADASFGLAPSKFAEFV